MGCIAITLALVSSAIMALAAPDPKPGWFSDLFGTPLPATGYNLVKEALEGRLENVKDLVERGVDVNFGGGEVLAMAARNGYANVVKYLLEAGANPDGEPEGPLKGGPLSQASKGNHLEVIDLLLKAGATVKFEKYGRGILDEASRNGHLEALQKILEAGADPNYNDGYALLLAAKYGHVDVLKALIDAGGDVNADRGWIMNSAADKGQMESVKVLLEAGASEQSMNSSLKAAASSGHLEIAKLLLEKGANPRYNGVLKEAATNGNVELVRSLLEAGAEIVYNDQYGFPLHFAASKGHVDVIILLVQYGGDINKQLRKNTWWDYTTSIVEYGKGWTVLHVLARFGYPEIEELVNLGADINMQDAQGQTPLHIAASYAKQNVVRELLKFCPDASLEDSEGKTAAEVADFVASQPPANTSEYELLMQTLKDVFSERFSSLPHNDQTTRLLVRDFLALLRTDVTFNETLKDVDTSYIDIQTAVYYMFEERDKNVLLTPFSELYCKPTLPRDMKISMGTEFLSKCECVPGQGSTMTFTPLAETNICQFASSTQESEPSTAD